MMTLQQLYTETEKDVGDDLITTNSKIPYLYDKYLKLLITNRLELTRKKQEYSKLYKDKHEYYTGKKSPQTYKEKPFDIKVLKGDLPIYLNADDDLAKMNEGIEYQKAKIEFLEQTLKNISNKSFACKNYIEWEKLQNGIT
jgi:hypothetical protein